MDGFKQEKINDLFLHYGLSPQSVIPLRTGKFNRRFIVKFGKKSAPTMQCKCFEKDRTRINADATD
jgi:hypothetical protein